MSQTGPFIKVQSVSPPLKGSFPLDHEGICKLEMLSLLKLFNLTVFRYMCCLHEKKQLNTECRDNAKAYFKCRMEHGLMDNDEWEKLGYANNN
uniref:Cytochrome c oxidase assembly protein COX19 n=1 Tax=Heterorhabditis bacteriophora TaxID=37862 RepID=A0A1I7XBY0_HETBA